MKCNHLPLKMQAVLQLEAPYTIHRRRLSAIIASPGSSLPVCHQTTQAVIKDASLG